MSINIGIYCHSSKEKWMKKISILFVISIWLFIQTTITYAASSTDAGASGGSSGAGVGSVVTSTTTATIGGVVAAIAALAGLAAVASSADDQTTVTPSSHH
jgi:Na+/proline symporter